MRGGKGRWLHDLAIVDDYLTFWLAEGRGDPLTYSSWIGAAAWQRHALVGNASFAASLAAGLERVYDAKVAPLPPPPPRALPPPDRTLPSPGLERRRRRSEPTSTPSVSSSAVAQPRRSGSRRSSLEERVGSCGWGTRVFVTRRRRFQVARYLRNTSDGTPCWWQNDGADAMEVSVSGSGCRPTMAAIMFGEVGGHRYTLRFLAHRNLFFSCSHFCSRFHFRFLRI